MLKQILLLSIILILLACGYKGPLYLPKNNGGNNAPSPTPARNQYAPTSTTAESRSFLPMYVIPESAATRTESKESAN